MDSDDLEANSSRPLSTTERSFSSGFPISPQKLKFRNNRADPSSPESETGNATSSTPLLMASPPRNTQPTLHARQNIHSNSTSNPLQTGTFHHALIMERRAEIRTYLGESLVLAFMSSICCVSFVFFWCRPSLVTTHHPRHTRSFCCCGFKFSLIYFLYNCFIWSNSGVFR